MKLGTFLLITVASGAIDILVTKWTIYVHQRAAAKAGITSVLWHLVNGACIIEYSKEPRYVIAMALGGFLGTVGGIWSAGRHEHPQPPAARPG